MAFLYKKSSESTLGLNSSEVVRPGRPVDETLAPEKDHINGTSTGSKYVYTDWPSNSDEVVKQSD